MSASAWTFGNYKRGMGVEGDDPRMIYACRAIKREMVYLGYTDIDLEDDRFGPNTRRAVKDWQSKNNLKADGEVGPATANSLWRRRIDDEQKLLKIPLNWIRAQIHWESLDDPGAQYTNPDGSRDRGLIQLNSVTGALEDDGAFDPGVSIPFLGHHHHAGAKMYRDCEMDKHRLAVGRWRTPVGAEEWCADPGIEPNQDGTWGEKAAFYVERVNTIGRLGWVG